MGLYASELANASHSPMRQRRTELWKAGGLLEK